MIFNKNMKVSYVIALILIFCLATLPERIRAEEANKHDLDVYFFYNNPCESCNEGGKFYDTFENLVGKEKEDINYNIFINNLIKEGAEEKFQDFCIKYKVPEDKRIMPLVFFGDTYLSGYDAINNNLKDEFIKVKKQLLKTNTSVSGESGSSNIKGESNNKSAEVSKEPDASSVLKAEHGTDSVVIYFYVSSCSDCSKVEKVLEKLKPVYDINAADRRLKSNLKLVKYNVGEPKNLDLVKQYFREYNVPYKDQKVPLLFIGRTYISESETKLSDIENLIKNGVGTSTLLPGNGEWKADAEVLSSGRYSFTGIIFTGLINGLNPCSLSMLLFFFSLLLSRGINILKYGVSFIAGKFVAYILLGTIAYKLLLLIDGSYIRGVQFIIKIVLLAIVVVLAAANIGDYFSAKNEKYDKIRMQLPKVLRAANHKWIKRFTGIENVKLLVFACFILGVVISVGEFLCTGQIYLATIIYALKNGSDFNLKAFSVLLIYVAAMIIPLLLLTFVIYKGREVYDISETIRQKMHVIKAVNAFVFLAFAIVIFYIF